MWEQRLERLPKRQIALNTVYVADNPIARLLGLAWMDEPPPGTSLWIPRCRSVQTFGMRFPLVLFWLDEQEVMIGSQTVEPRRVATDRWASSVVELVAGPDNLLKPDAQRGQRKVFGDVQLE
jgi:uncharacterized membrane protein (UPF0127 family)